MQDLDAWKAARKAALMADDGWLNLTDRVEIGAGPQKVGKAPGNDLVLSVGPDHLGVLTLEAGSARFTSEGRVQMFAPAPGGFPQLHLPPLLLEIGLTVLAQNQSRIHHLLIARRTRHRLEMQLVNLQTEVTQ